MINRVACLFRIKYVSMIPIYSHRYYGAAHDCKSYKDFALFRLNIYFIQFYWVATNDNNYINSYEL